MNLNDKYRKHLKISKSIIKNQTSDMTTNREVLEAALKEKEEQRIMVEGEEEKQDNAGAKLVELKEMLNHAEVQAQDFEKVVEKEPIKKTDAEKNQCQFEKLSKLLENERTKAKDLLTKKKLKIIELETKLIEEKDKKNNLKQELVQEQLKVKKFQLLLEDEAKEKKTAEAKSKKLEKMVEEEKELRTFWGEKYAREKFRSEDLLVDNKNASDRNEALKKHAEEWKTMLIEEEEETRKIQRKLWKAEEEISDLNDLLEEETEKAKYATKRVAKLKACLAKELMKKDAIEKKLTQEIVRSNELNQQFAKEIENRMNGESKIEELLTLLEEIEINAGKKKSESINPARIKILEFLLRRRKYKCDETDDVDAKVEKRTKKLHAILADEIEKRKNSQKKEEKAKNSLRKEKRKRKNLEQDQRQSKKVMRKYEKEIKKRKQTKYALYQERFLREEAETMLNNEASHNQALERQIQENTESMDNLKKSLENVIQEKTIYQTKFVKASAEAKDIETQLMNKFCRIVDLENEIKNLKQIIENQNSIKEKSEDALLEEQQKNADLEQINIRKEQKGQI